VGFSGGCLGAQAWSNRIDSLAGDPLTLVNLNAFIFPSLLLIMACRRWLREQIHLIQILARMGCKDIKQLLG